MGHKESQGRGGESLALEGSLDYELEDSVYWNRGGGSGILK